MKITIYVYTRNTQTGHFNIGQRVIFSEAELERLAIESYLDNNFATEDELKEKGIELSATVENVSI